MCATFFFTIFVHFNDMQQQMGRILAIDYGRKRTGLAVTDPMRLIASPLETVPTSDLMGFLTSYMAKEPVDLMVIGKPTMLNGMPSETEKVYIEPAVKALRNRFPNVTVEMMDERFTSKIAFRSMIDGGLKKSGRQDKATIDKVSAALLLQSYLTQEQIRGEREASSSGASSSPSETLMP